MNSEQWANGDASSENLIALTRWDAKASTNVLTPSSLLPIRSLNQSGLHFRLASSRH